MHEHYIYIVEATLFILVTSRANPSTKFQRQTLLCVQAGVMLTSNRNTQTATHSVAQWAVTRSADSRDTTKYRLAHGTWEFACSNAWQMLWNLFHSIVERSKQLETQLYLYRPANLTRPQNETATLRPTVCPCVCAYGGCARAQKQTRTHAHPRVRSGKVSCTLKTYICCTHALW